MSAPVRATDEWVRIAQAWVDEDPDPATRAELEELLVRASTADPAEAAAALADLEDRFSGPLEFGTAGLRGRLGAGPFRMNRVVVTRAAAGLVAHLLAHGAQQGDRVVIGYDARNNSDVFARDTAEVVSGAGLRALVLPRPLPTPVLAYAIRDLGCVAGVMVTASHNPPEDNGYKVYLGDGSQIVPPTDAEISSRIAAVGAMADVVRGDGGELVDEDLVDRYFSSVTALVDEGPRDLHVVYTPLHGVGGVTVRRALRDAGFPEPTVVQEQFAPDPAFPTVSFPNPEEPGALDLALATAQAREEAGQTVDLVLANDPDADRLAAAVRGPHGWQALRGDEIGALIAHHLMSTGREGTYATTIVSSSLLQKMAAAAGQPYAETLTGFKWLGLLDNLAYGYEEALGYCVDPSHVRDKDGVSAAVVLCELAAALKAEGRTLLDVLDDLARTHGLHATDQLAVRFDDLSLIGAALERLRATPPAALGGLEVTRVDDLRTGSAALPPTDGLRLMLGEGARVVVRPSGTEPTLKCYLEVVVDVHPDDGVDAARIAAAGRLDAIKADLREAAGI